MDRGVAGVERYRQEHGVKDSSRAFGREAKRGAERARQLSKGLESVDERNARTYRRFKHRECGGRDSGLLLCASISVTLLNRILLSLVLAR